MELRQAARYSYDSHTRPGSDVRIVEDRLNQLLTANREIVEEKSLYRSDRERLEAMAMSKPVSTEKAFAYLGLMLGSLTPAAMFLAFLMEVRLGMDGIWVLGLMVLANLTSALVGFFTGKKVARSVRHLNSLPVSRSMIILPFVGVVWGMAAGAAGGIFLFLIGALFGAVIGGTVGAVALPSFAILYRILKRGDNIDFRYFLPISIGITLTICAFFLGLEP